MRGKRGRFFRNICKGHMGQNQGEVGSGMGGGDGWGWGELWGGMETTVIQQE